MVTPHPDCPNDPTSCRMNVTSTVAQPVIEWAPIYDGTGATTNRDPNTFIAAITCATCGMSWEERRTGDEVTVTPLMPAQIPAT